MGGSTVALVIALIENGLPFAANLIAQARQEGRITDEQMAETLNRARKADKRLDEYAAKVLGERNSGNGSN